MVYTKEKQKEYAKQHYLDNKELYKRRTGTRVSLLRRIAHELKLNPCTDCKQLYPYYIMQFDHRPGELKIRNISSYREFSSVSKFLEEIDKCDLVCANCHAERTLGPNNNGRFHEGLSEEGLHSPT